MNKLKKTFEALFEKFGKKKSFFERQVDRWKSRGKITLHEKGKGLLERLEEEGAELKEMLSDAGSSAKKSAVSAKVKLFGKLYKQMHEASKPVWRQWLEALVIAGVVALLLRHFVFGLYHVPTGSAEPTILVGDRAWGNKLAYTFGSIERGDLIIFDNPQHKYEKAGWLKRAWQKYVGLPIPFLGIGAGPINVTKRVNSQEQRPQ